MTQAPKTILVVDDDAELSDGIKIMLEHKGHQVIQARDGKQARELVDRIRPDLVILDVMMPGMDGPSTLKKMQADFDLSTIPVVFMTAKVQANEIESYKALGAADVVVKPFVASGFENMQISNMDLN